MCPFSLVKGLMATAQFQPRKARQLCLPPQSEALSLTFELKSGSQLPSFAHKAPDDKRPSPQL